MSHKKFLIIRLIIIRLIVYMVFMANIFLVINFINTGNTIAAITIIIVSIVLFLLSIILFGRVFCGFLCPLGLLFDIEWKITELLHLPKLNRNEKFINVMIVLSKIFLLFFICGILSIIFLLIIKPSVFDNFSIPLIPIIFVSLFMIIINVFAKRLFCNVCPIGSFIGLFYKFNIIKLKKEPSSCFSCGACYEICPMKIKSIYTETRLKDLSNPRCLYCGECIVKCSEDNALSFCIKNRIIYKSSKEEFLKTQFSDIKIKD